MSIKRGLELIKQKRLQSLNKTNGKIYIGIDPGDNGGFTLMSVSQIIFQKMPDTPGEILEFFGPYKNNNRVIVILEKVGGMPKMGGSSMFNFGKGYGYLEMALLANGLKTITVSPQKWQKFYNIGTKAACSSPTEWKNKLKAKAQQLFPRERFFLWNADATLICEYGRANNLS